MAAHAGGIYRKLTNRHEKFLRVDELVDETAKLVPGLTPAQRQVKAENALMQSEKDGVEIDQGIFLAHVLAVPGAGMHLCEAMLRPKPEALERVREFVAKGVIDLALPESSARAKPPSSPSKIRASLMPRTTTRSPTPRPRLISPFSIR